MSNRNPARVACCVLVTAAGVALSGCGREPDAGAANPASFVGSSGQVTVAPAPPADPNAFAAARFLDHASFGPTPAAIAEVRQLGMAAWIDAQLALPAPTLNAPQSVIDYDTNNPAEKTTAFSFLERSFHDLAVGGRAQLRLKMTWALYNYIVANSGAYGRVVYYNTLVSNALGNYSDLLRAVTLSTPMGVFLNNNDNQAARLNENYGRELLQLFSVGLVQLNDDGTVKRDAGGAALETYSQADVVAATRALTGWEIQWQPNLPTSNWANFGKPMVPRQWPPDAHDTGQKTLLGGVIPANQTVSQDLDSLIAIIVNHPNTAPFVATRLIQNLVTSDPSPAYVARISMVFRSSGGNLGQVAKAILLDSEARRADDPRQASNQVGRFREPFGAQVAMFRALGCASAPRNANNPEYPMNAWTQAVFDAPTVFGYFPPNHRAPGSLLLAPEQKLFTYQEYARRLGQGWEFGQPTWYANAGCQLDLFVAALAKSEDALLDLVSQRFFRGSMPPALRVGAKSLLRNELSNETNAHRKVGQLLSVLLVTPSAGVVR